MNAGAPHSATGTEWLNRLKLEWTELAQLAGRNLLSEDQITAFASRLSKLTSHVTNDLSMVVLLGLKMKFKTAAELVIDFVSEMPIAPLPDKLDILQLLERFVDKQFCAFIRDKNIVVSSDEQDAILSTHRKEFEDSHMQAALLSRLNENDVNELETQPLFGENNMDRFHNIASGTEKPYFVESMVDGKPQFVDVIFANYFGAKWFAAGHFVENAAFLAQRFYSPRRTVMRYLFDRILARNCDLHVAVLHDDVTGVRRLLEDQGIDADQRDIAGRTALHLAAARKTSEQTLKANTEILDLVIKHTIDINIEDELFAGSPLFYADMSNAWPAIDKLLSCGADTGHLPSTSMNLYSAAMLDAIIEHDLSSLMAFCLDKGLSVEYSVHGTRLLTWACDYGSLRVSILLIARGANINAVVSDDESPLSAASGSGSLGIVSLLVLNAKLAARLEASQHACAYINDISLGVTALHTAVACDNVDVMAYLIKEGADLWLRESRVSGQTPLHYAFPSTKAVAILLAAVDPARLVEYVNVADFKGTTAMHLAAMFGQLSGAKQLVRAGASVTSRDAKGRTPLIGAASTATNNLSTVKYLIETVDGQLKGDYVNARDDEGKTALHWAAFKGHDDIRDLLIDQGASVSIPDNVGNLPLDYTDLGNNVPPASPSDTLLGDLLQWVFSGNQH